MSFIGATILTSFVLVAVALGLLLISRYLKHENKKLILAHYLVGILALVIYAVTCLIVVFDGQSWNKFKTELIITLVIFLLTYLGIYLSKIKQRVLSYYLMILILIVTVVIMNLKWSGLI